MLRNACEDYSESVPFKQPGKAELVLNADIAGYSDRVTRSIVVKPLGFPVESGFWWIDRRWGNRHSRNRNSPIVDRWQPHHAGCHLPNTAGQHERGSGKIDPRTLWMF